MSGQQPIKLSSPGTGEFWRIPVLYEDEQLIALDKPAGLLTAPDAEYPDRPSLIGLMHKAIAEPKPWVKERTLSYLMHIRRLDAEASGVLLLAKTKPVLTKLLDSLGTTQQANLWFLALVQGSPSESRFSVAAKLAPHPVKAGLMRISPKQGKRARTDFEVVERFSQWTLLRCAPLELRPHQIRVHLAHAGLHVAGDESYGGKPLLLSMLKRDYHLKPNHTERPLISQPCLHAEQLTVAHPVTGETLSVTAPWPKDLAVAVKYLRKYASR